MSVFDLLIYRIVEVPYDEIGGLQIFYFGFNAIFFEDIMKEPGFEDFDQDAEILLLSIHL